MTNILTTNMYVSVQQVNMARRQWFIYRYDLEVLDILSIRLVEFTRDSSGQPVVLARDVYRGQTTSLILACCLVAKLVTLSCRNNFPVIIAEKWKIHLENVNTNAASLLM